MKPLGWLAVIMSLVLWAAAPGRSAPALIQFDRYHSWADIERYLGAVVAAHRDLATLVDIGRSRAGRIIRAVEINNPRTGPAAGKPAFYIDGNIHGGEVLGGEAALSMIDLLLGRHGSDPAIRDLVDTRAFYIVPIVNPDGREISVGTPENHRWNIRPVDEDGDGRADEDPPEDLDHDGRILQMRVRDPNGEWIISADDGRLMVRGGLGARYRVYAEGIDNDGDGRFNEDRVGGVDVNRNFPSNWHPAQLASGPYPLSEPESRALVEYITARPNIAAVHTFHTSGGMILRFPTLADQNWDFPEADLKDYDEIARRGVEITGYDNYAYDKKPIIDRMNPGHGVFNDWASNVFGVLAMTTEMWKHPGGASLETFQWNDRVLGGRGFIAWHPFQHPQLGAVELGGWDRWSLASPPEPLIAAELDRNARWVLTFAERLPRVAILGASASAGSEPGTFDVEARVANAGWMATATAYAAQVLKIAKPVVARLDLTNAEVVGDTAAQPRGARPGERVLGVLPGARERGPVETPVRWRIRAIDPSKTPGAVVEVVSEKAGTARRVVALPGWSR